MSLLPLFQLQGTNLAYWQPKIEGNRIVYEIWATAQHIDLHTSIQIKNELNNFSCEMAVISSRNCLDWFAYSIGIQWYQLFIKSLCQMALALGFGSCSCYSITLNCELNNYNRF